MEMAKPIYVAKLRRARAPWAFDLGPVALTFVTIVLMAVTSLLYLTQASRVAATGYDIRDADVQRVHLEREQQQLLVTQAQLQGMERIESEATGRLGMVPAAQPEYVAVSVPAVDVDAALARAMAEAQHAPKGWRERIVAAMGLSQDAPATVARP